MKYLLDTHVILWWLTESKKISPTARNIISNKENMLFISSVSFWEMAIKQELGRLKLPTNIIKILEAEGFSMLPLSPEESLSIIDLPKIHNDPFDRMLIVQAKLNDLVFITKDHTILKYPLLTLKA